MSYDILKFRTNRIDAEERISAQIEKGQQLLIKIDGEADIDTLDSAHDLWDSFNGALLETLFSAPRLAMRYRSSILGYVPMWGISYQYLRARLKNKLTVLESIRQELPLYEEQTSHYRYAEDRAREIDGGRKIFLVHGQDGEMKQNVARFLETIDVELVILEEPASKGNTLIEKLEEHALVPFAIVLLSPDDVGGLSSSKIELKRRARQNVIFELGYFIGKLGRARTCVVHKGEVDIPTDFAGVVYVPYDRGGGWKLRLVKELEAAGFEIDRNKMN